LLLPANRKKPMIEEADFHKAMLDSPNDLALRMVLADWLEERGCRSAYRCWDAPGDLDYNVGVRVCCCLD
jgi:uncharacterized protein (TIGR02996 family)